MDQARGPGVRFKPGQTGNPGGRPKTKGFPERIRQATRDGEELIEVALQVLRDTELSASTRLKALEWLGDRMLGKAPQLVAVEQVDPEKRLSFEHMPLEERLELERLMTRALEGPAVVDASDGVTVEADAPETQH